MLHNTSTNRRLKHLLGLALVFYSAIWCLCSIGLIESNTEKAGKVCKEECILHPPIRGGDARSSKISNGEEKYPTSLSWDRPTSPLMKSKHILLFGSFNEMMTWPELDLFRRMFNDNIAKTGSIECLANPVSLTISVSNNVSDFKGKDVVIFGILGKAFKENVEELIRTRPYPKQTWVYFSTETPHRIVKWTQNLRFKELKYHVMMTYRRDSEVQIPFGFYDERSTGSVPFEEGNIVEAFQNKSKFIYWMGSNCGEVYWPRMGYIRHLKHHVPLETFGRCGETECLPIRSDKCLNRLSNEFKFSLSVANSECTDYITEKLWSNALSKYIIPVVYGAPKENYEKVAPPNSFIHISDFNTTEELADYLNQVAENEQLYRKYFKWKKKYEVHTSFPVDPMQLCKLVPHLYNGTEQTVKRLGDSPWYNGCRTPITKATLRGVPPKVQEEKIAKWAIWRP